MTKFSTRNRTFYKYAIGVLRHGFIDSETGKRQGKYADGFDPASGYDLRRFNEWTPAQKARITKAFKVVDSLASRPYQIYKTTNKKRLNKVQRASQHETFPKWLKVAFVPTNGQREKVRVRITKRGIVKFKQGSVNRQTINFQDYGYTLEDVALDPVAVTQNVVSQVKATRYKIQAGEHEVNRGKSLGVRPGNSWPGERITAMVQRMVNYYSADKYDPEDSNSSYFGNWLFGLVAYNFDVFDDYRKYQVAYQNTRRATKRKRAALRSKLRRDIAKNKSKHKR